MKVYNGKIEYTIVLDFTVNAQSEEEAMKTAENSATIKPEFITSKEILSSRKIENYNLGLISHISTK